MTSTTDEYDFSGSQGADHAQESMKQGDFEREIEFLKLDGSPAGKQQGKDHIVIRFATDSVRRDETVPSNKFNLAWITVAGHYAPTKPKPPYYTGTNWPAKWGCGCRKDPVFAAKFGGECLLCSQGSKPSKGCWALGIERVEVKGEHGETLGWADKTREVFDRDADGKAIVIGKRDDGKDEYQMKTVPAWIVCQKGWKNFYQPLSGQAAYHTANAQAQMQAKGLTGGSGLLDSDWLITRTGSENNDTSYTPIRVGSVQIPAENPWGVPEMPYDLSGILPDGRTLAEAVYGDELPDLRRLISEKVSDEVFGYWFDPSWMPADFDPSKVQQQGQQKAQSTGFVMGGGAAPATPSQPAGEEPSSNALEALKSRVSTSAGSTS